MNFWTFLDDPFSKLSDEKKQRLEKLSGVLRFAAAGMCIFVALVKFITCVALSAEPLNVFSAMLTMSGFILLSVALFARKRILALIGFGLLCASGIVCVISAAFSLGEIVESASSWHYGKYYTTTIIMLLISELKHFLIFVAFVAVFVAIMITMGVIRVRDKFLAVIRKLWFAPVICFVLAYLVGVIHDLIGMGVYGLEFRTMWSGFVFIVEYVCASLVIFLVINPYGFVRFFERRAIVPVVNQPVYTVPQQGVPAQPYQAPTAPAQPYQAPAYQAPTAPAQPYQAPAYQAPTAPAQPYQAPAYQAPTAPARPSVAVNNIPYDDEKTVMADEVSVAPADTVAAELRQYKALLDAGVITQADYDAKKRQLLGL